MSTKIAIIGAGNMGKAMAQALAVDRRWSVFLTDRPGVEISPLPRVKMIKRVGEGLRDVDVVIVAVKPQDAQEALQSLRGHLAKNAIVISIMAGVPLRVLTRETGWSRVVRAMPNMPAQIKQGMTVWCALHRISAKDLLLVGEVLQAFGKETRVKNEDLIDAATAISGSGPAYVFALAEYLVLAARDLGFSQASAELMTKQMILGSAMLLAASDEDPAALRMRVTSKKGTTEAAFKVFEKKKTSVLYRKAVQAAFVRAQALSRLWD